MGRGTSKAGFPWEKFPMGKSVFWISKTAKSFGLVVSLLIRACVFRAFCHWKFCDPRAGWVSGTQNVQTDFFPLSLSGLVCWSSCLTRSISKTAASFGLVVSVLIRARVFQIRVAGSFVSSVLVGSVGRSTFSHGKISHGKKCFLDLENG